MLTIAEFIGGYGAGRIYAAILPGGVVTPCEFLLIPVGNVKERSCEVVWSRSPLLNTLRGKDSLKGFCHRCLYRNVWRLVGRGLGLFGAPLEVDPGCVYNYNAWRSLKEFAGVREKEAEAHTSSLKVAPAA